MTAAHVDQHLARAWVLAEQGRGRTVTNPIVGCVIERDGEVVGEGYHPVLGGPHAEIVALQEAGQRARGATAWVTLEPCDHTGRTGPCTHALIDAGVARVVIGARDPSDAAGGGAARLAAAGVEVVHLGLDELVREQNRTFFAAVEWGRPWVTLKIAATAEGDMVTADQWITGMEARTQVHRLRAEAHAVLVGSGTVLADDPELSVRHVDLLGHEPVAIVLDRRGRTPADARVVRQGTLVLTTPEAVRSDWADRLEAGGAQVVAVEGGLEDQLRRLVELGIHHVLAEPGPTLATALCVAGVVDEVVLHQAPGDQAPGLPAPLAGHRWRHVRTRALGDDVETVLQPEGS